MNTRLLASLEVSEIGLGCMGMSIAYGERDDKQSAETIHRALDLGVSFIDTADMYGQGHNEELVGGVLKTRRSEAVVATKFGNIKTPDGKAEVRGDPEYVVEACEKSLTRLNTDVIDLYYLHRVDTRVPIEDTAGALKQLVEQGKVRHIGLSEAAPETIRRAHAVHPLTAVQTEYSLWTREVESEVLPTCRELGIGFVAYSPLGRGFLSGTIPTRDSLIEGDRRRDHPRFEEENIAQNMALVDVLKSIASDLQATPAQVAIAWLLSKGPDIVPIPGTKKISWLEENVAATQFSLTSEQIDRLEGVFRHGTTAGERYPEPDMKRLML